jgi:hypothetical protein
MTLPLSGLLVVSLEQAVAAPMSTCRLADAGARVIKIERPEGEVLDLFGMLFLHERHYIKALREFNFEIPRDVSIVGFDNLPMSSVDVSKKQIGYLAISVLDDLVRSSEPWPPVKILVGAQLIVRESVAAKRT